MTQGSSSRQLSPSSVDWRLRLTQALRTAADREHRSTANMIEVIIREHCARNGIIIPEQSPLFSGDDTSPTNR